MFLHRTDELLRIHVDAQVHYLEPGSLHHHRHQVLADVVDIALHRPDDERADLRRAGLYQQRAQDLHAGLHRLGGHEHFGHEEYPVAEVRTYDVHAGHERPGQNLVGRQAAPQQFLDRGHNFGRQSIVQVVLDLQDDLLSR